MNLWLLPIQCTFCIYVKTIEKRSFYMQAISNVITLMSKVGFILRFKNSKKGVYFSLMKQVKSILCNGKDVYSFFSTILSKLRISWSSLLPWRQSKSSFLGLCFKLVSHIIYWQVQDEGLKCSLAEKDAIISNLQKSSAEKDGMIENLRDLLEGQAKGESAKEDLFKQLTSKLKDKEKQLQVSLSTKEIIKKKKKN